MKAKLTFDMNDPDDRNQFDIATKGMDMALILWEIAFNKRKQLLEFEIAEEAIDNFYSWFNEELTERGINIETLIR